MFLEPLESRIAPASLTFVNDRTVKWTDSDGDAVTLTITAGTIDLTNFTTVDNGQGLIVKKIDLTAMEFAGTSISLFANRDVIAGALAGNGLADIGYIDATGNALGKVFIDGDLGRIDAGPAVLADKASTGIASLRAYTIGTRLDILDPVLPQSEINGKIGALTVPGAIRGAIHVSGGALGSIDKVDIGALIGSALSESGRIDVTGSIKSLNVRGDILGGAGQRSGSVEAGIAIGKATINGSIHGGQSDTPSTDGTGVIRAGSTIGSVTVRGSIFGGSQQESGLIDAGGAIESITVSGSIYGGDAGLDNGGIRAGSLGKVKITGDVQGGAAEHSGFIETDGVKTLSLLNLIGGAGNRSGFLDLGSVPSLTITGDLVGGDLGVGATADLENSGGVKIDGVKKLVIGGSIRAGVDSSATFDLQSCAAIRSANEISSIVVRGSLLGNETARVLITARGATVVQPSADLAIGKASFGDVAYADILAGYDTASDLTVAAVNPNAQIGSVSVLNTWTASNLVAGAAYNPDFGDGTDEKSGGSDNANINSRIASLTIKGRFFGTQGAGDHFGFVAQTIDSIRIGKLSIPLNAGAANDSDTASLRYNLANTLDVRVFELAL